VEMKSVESKEGKVAFTVSFTIEGQNQDFAVQAAFDGSDALKGTWKTADGNLSGDFKAKREVETGKPAGGLAARYVIAANLPDGQTLRVNFEPKVEAGKLGGAIILRGGQKVQVSAGSFRDGSMEAEAEIPYQGQTVRVRLTGTVGDRGVIKGSWSSDQGSGDWTGRPVEDI
jgi:hypothetical protein